MNPFALFFKVGTERRFSQALRITSCSMMIIATLAFPEISRSEPLFGSWVGQAQVGEKLKVNVTVFGLNNDSQSQLKATCMEAWAESEGSESNSLQTRMPLNLDYEKTLDRGGLVTLSSPLPIREPVVRVHLASNCPLVTFVQTWDLQLDFPAAGMTLENAFSNANAQYPRTRGIPVHTVAPSEFNAADSPTLAASFKTPVFKNESQPPPQAAYALPALDSSKPEKSKMINPTTDQISPKNPKLENLTQTNEELALIQLPQLSRQPPQLENSEMSRQASASQSLGGGANGPTLTGDEINLIPFVLFGGISLLMIAFGIWWGQRQRMIAADDGISSNNQSMFAKLLAKLGKESKAQNSEGRSALQFGHLEPERFIDEIELSSNNVGASKDGQKDIDVSNKQLFASFFGGGQSFDDSSENYSSQPLKNSKNIQLEVKQSVSTVSMVLSSQGLNMGSWHLPESFHSLLPGRSAMEWGADQSHISRLKCEIGLIELAFLNAQQEEAVCDIQIAELLETSDGEIALERTEQKANVPSELIKDFVRSRVCELGSKRAIEQFTQSLQAMYSSRYCEKLSMANGVWLEFISDLDIR